MNPRKRKLVRDGRMNNMVQEVGKQDKSTSKHEVSKNDQVPMDPFIAKELEEIERIPSNEKKTTTKKKKGGK
tara:strand:- start:1640 stop:1855 length:216 start_codon:yes stop_codon:yes gene_type:complete